MKEANLRKLKKLLRLIEEAKKTIDEIIFENENVAPRKENLEPIESDKIVEEIRNLDRPAAEEKLQRMKQKDLGLIFVETGGDPSERKRPKNWLVEQILWRIFDFKRGHQRIRDS